LGNNIGYNIRYEAGTNMFTGTFPYHYIILGANTTNDYNNAVALGTNDAWNIDAKIDDGLPGQGTVVTYTNTAHPNCASSDVAATAAYQLNVDNSTQACILLFRVNLHGASPVVSRRAKARVQAALAPYLLVLVFRYNFGLLPHLIQP
jgi:hypothetical protein